MRVMRVSLILATAVISVPAVRATQSLARTPPQVVKSEACIGVIEGATRPEDVPSYLTWETLFAMLQGNDDPSFRRLGVDENTKQLIAAHAQQALGKRQVALSRSGTTVITNPRESPDRIGAEGILTSRDDLIRAVPETTVTRLREVAYEQTRLRTFQLPAQGRFVDIEDVQRCLVTVKGSEFPHLIPESEYWEFYFLALTLASSQISGGADKYSPDYIRAVQTYALRMDAALVVKVLDVATDTHHLVEDLKRQGADGTSVAAVVLAARDELLRSLPGPAWLEVNKEASRTRDGVTFVFNAYP
jgi:hypothetical protein